MKNRQKITVDISMNNKYLNQHHQCDDDYINIKEYKNINDKEEK